MSKLATAQQLFDIHGAGEERDPVERLRAFCSFAMNGRDWIDAEPHFDAVCAEVASLKRDAERYRGLREMPQFFGWDADYRPDEIDTQVDAALAAKEK